MDGSGRYNVRYRYVSYVCFFFLLFTNCLFVCLSIFSTVSLSKTDIFRLYFGFVVVVAVVVVVVDVFFHFLKMIRISGVFVFRVKCQLPLLSRKT